MDIWTSPVDRMQSSWNLNACVDHLGMLITTDAGPAGLGTEILYVYKLSHASMLPVRAPHLG